MYSRLKKDLNAVENRIQQEHISLAHDIKSLSGQMVEMENTLIMKMENQTKKELYGFSDEYYYHDNIGKGRLNFFIDTRASPQIIVFLKLY